MESLGVHFVEVRAQDEGQRVDNFIRKLYPKLPKGRIYQMLRKGEVRLNKKRVQASERVKKGDSLRLPPLFFAKEKTVSVPKFWCARIERAVLYECADFLILNKPAGIAVHGGSGMDYGLIDVVYEVWGKGYAELAHRLDSATSGVLVLGKNRNALLGFQALLERSLVEKLYLALLSGQWRDDDYEVVLYLQKIATASGDRVCVREDGKRARTFFSVLRRFKNCSLVQARLDTGRTHQIRVTVQSRGLGIAGDEKYGDFVFNRKVRKLGFKGMFLHAHRIAFRYNQKEIVAEAPLSQAHQDLLLKGESFL